LRKYVPRKPVLSVIQRTILQSASIEPLRLNKCRTRYGKARYNLGSVLRLRDRNWLRLASDGGFAVSLEGYRVLKSTASDLKERAYYSLYVAWRRILSY
jgi:hypothetical protein